MARKGIPILDFDDLITAIQALSAPSGTDVAISPTGMHIVTENDVQGAISELDSAVDSVNSSLTQNIVTERFDMGEQTIGAGARGVFTTSVAKTGYTPLGIIEVALSNNYYYVGSYTIGSNNMAQVVMHSGSTTSTAQRVYITVIYKKN